jgi:hypothetical protein
MVRQFLQITLQRISARSIDPHTSQRGAPDDPTPLLFSIPDSRLPISGDVTVGT